MILKYPEYIKKVGKSIPEYQAEIKHIKKEIKKLNPENPEDMDRLDKLELALMYLELVDLHA